MPNDLTNYDAKLAELAKEWAEVEKPNGGAWLSTKGGVLKFGEEMLPGNQAACIILHSVRENTYYTDKYDPDSPAAPVCYAFGSGPDAEETMGPHISMKADLSYFAPQAHDCKSCRWNEWGSANQGRGKACQNRRRMALLCAGMYEPVRGSRDFNLKLMDDPAYFRSAEIVKLKLPVTSVQDWAKYVANTSAQHQMPPYGVITRVSLEPDAKTQYRVHFEMLERVPDALLQIVFQRVEEAQRTLIQGYQPPETKQEGQNGLRGLGGRR